MYNVINKSEIIDLYNVRRDITMYRFLSKHDLYMFLGQHTSYLDDIYLNSNYIRVDYYEHGQYYDDDWNFHTSSYRSENIREYMFVDGYDRIIDPRLDNDKISIIIKHIYQHNNSNTFDYIRYIKAWSKECELAPKPFSTLEYKKKKYKQNNNLPVFRKDPIPHVTHNKVGRPYYRRQKTFNERKQNADPEIYKYVRPCRRHNSMIRNAVAHSRFKS